MSATRFPPRITGRARTAIGWPAGQKIESSTQFDPVGIDAQDTIEKDVVLPNNETDVEQSETEPTAPIYRLYNDPSIENIAKAILGIIITLIFVAIVYFALTQLKKLKKYGNQKNDSKRVGTKDE